MVRLHLKMSWDHSAQRAGCLAWKEASPPCAWFPMHVFLQSIDKPSKLEGHPISAATSSGQQSRLVRWFS